MAPHKNFVRPQHNAVVEDTNNTNTISRSGIQEGGDIDTKSDYKGWTERDMVISASQETLKLIKILADSLGPPFGPIVGQAAGTAIAIMQVAEVGCLCISFRLL